MILINDCFQGLFHPCPSVCFLFSFRWLSWILACWKGFPTQGPRPNALKAFCMYYVRGRAHNHCHFSRVYVCVRVCACPSVLMTHTTKDHAIPCVCCAVPNLCIFWLVVWVQYCANLYPMYPDSLVQSFNTCLYNLTGRSQSPSCIFQQSVSHCMAIECLNSTLSFAGSAQWQTMCMRSGQGGLLSLCLAVCRHCCCSSAASLQLMLCL